MGESSLKHQLDSDLDTTNNANASEKESDKANLKDDHDPTMVAKDENKNVEKPVLVPSKDTREMCGNSGIIQVGGNHPLGMGLSVNTVEKIGLKNELDSASDKTNNANTGEIGSGKINLKDNYDPTMGARDEDKNVEKPGLVSNIDTRKTCGDSGKIHLGNNHSLRMTLSKKHSQGRHRIGNKIRPYQTCIIRNGV